MTGEEGGGILFCGHMFGTQKHHKSTYIRVHFEKSSGLNSITRKRSLSLYVFVYSGGICAIYEQNCDDTSQGIPYINNAAAPVSMSLSPKRIWVLLLLMEVFNRRRWHFSHVPHNYARHCIF